MVQKMLAEKQKMKADRLNGVKKTSGNPQAQQPASAVNRNFIAQHNSPVKPTSGVKP